MIEWIGVIGRLIFFMISGCVGLTLFEIVFLCISGKIEKWIRKRGRK